jgi:predicted GH43/DUF377 family glycosyl hydrolase
MPIKLNRKPVTFKPDHTRVIARFFLPDNPERTKSVIKRTLNLSDNDANLILTHVLRKFSKRHRNITKVFENHFNNLKDIFKEMDVDTEALPLDKRLLIGSYFTMEFSIESAAFFNPSIIEDPYQGDLQDGEKRIIVSFRATGEGHISSVVFRSGIIDKNNDLHFEPVGRLVDLPEVVKRHVYEKKSFLKKLEEMNVFKDVIGMVMDRLGDTFIYGELQAAIEETKKSIQLSYTKEKVIQAINWLADSHYEVTFSRDTAISERVLFPASYSESNGIEDARFVKFMDDDGSVSYYATYTAYNGFTILPKLLKTKDFYHFKIMPLHGIHMQNKGMSLFPRRLRGNYAMISRNDGSNNFINFSDNINVWHNTQKLMEPEYSWEFVLIGNCGSPIETEKGWLLITHGVGPMRMYSIGATLLDIENPTRVIGRLKEPLLVPNDKERDGYVPNVIYSCGSFIHNGELIIPYGISDYASSFATISMDELFKKLLGN